MIDAGPIAFVPDRNCPDCLCVIPNLKSHNMLVSFPELHEAEYLQEYRSLFYERLEDRTLPLGKLSKYDYKEIPLKGIRFQAIRLNRIRKTAFRFFPIIEALFSVNGRIISEWYVVPGEYDRTEGTWLFQDCLVYDSRRMQKSNLSPYLIPYLKDYESEAAALLSAYQPEALKKPCPIDAESLARAMGYQIKYVRLSLDYTIQGKLVFANTELTLYHADGNAYVEEIEESTILIDRNACKNRSCLIQSAIVHECVHAYEHGLFFDLQQSYCWTLHTYHLPPLEDYLKNIGDAECVLQMEQQTDRLTARVLMQKNGFLQLAESYQRKFEKDSPQIRMEKTIKALAKFYNTSLDMTKHRLIELGYQEAQGVLEYADGHYVPGFHLLTLASSSTTYTIPLLGLLAEAERNPEFAALITSGAYIYLENHVCLRHRNYIQKSNNKLALTAYAHAHLDECCLSFTVQNDRKNDHFTLGTLNKEENPSGTVYRYTNQFYQNLLQETKVSRQEEAACPETFYEATLYYKKKKNYSNLLISLVSHINKARIDRIINHNPEKRQHPCYYDATAIGLTLCPTPDLVIDLTEKAGYSTRKTSEQRYITRLVYLLFGEDMDEFNYAMTSAGLPPLVDENYGTA